MPDSKPNAAEQSDDLPAPWLALCSAADAWFYINPTTNPPTTTWTHPFAKDGEAHPEQVEDPQAAVKVVERFAAENPEAAQQVSERGLGSLLGRSSGGMGMGSSHSSSMGMAGDGSLGGMLLGALLSNKSSHNTYGFGGSSGYSHSMGPPPFMGGGMSPFSMSPFGMSGMGGMGGGPFGMGGMGGGMGMMGGPHGRPHGGGAFGGGFGGGHHSHEGGFGGGGFGGPGGGLGGHGGHLGVGHHGGRW
ncbi:unnamed protein product [Cutaneotrichosporon oleaginosum]